jgi:hypothetical protein
MNQKKPNKVWREIFKIDSFEQISNRVKGGTKLEPAGAERKKRDRTKEYERSKARNRQRD